MWQKMLQVGSGGGSGALSTYATLQLSTTDTDLIGKSVDIQFEDGTYGYNINPVTMNGTQNVKVQSLGNYSVLYNSDEVGSANVTSFTDYPIELINGLYIIKNGTVLDTYTTYNGQTVTENSGNYFEINKPTNYYGGITFDTMVNTSKYSSIKMQVSSLSVSKPEDSGFMLGASTNKGYNGTASYDFANGYGYTVPDASISTLTTYTCPITQSGTIYIKIRTWNSGGCVLNDAKITNLWLE